MEFNPEIYNSTSEVLVFRFRDGAGYNKFAEYAHEQESHIFVCDNQNFAVTTDAFTQEEALRMAKVALGLSTISVVSFKGVEFVSEGEIWSWIAEHTHEEAKYNKVSDKEIAEDYFNGCYISSDNKTGFDEKLIQNMSVRYSIPVSEIKAVVALYRNTLEYTKPSKNKKTDLER